MPDQATISHSGVIAVRKGRICLVTSSGGRRWVIPKGGLEYGKTAAETALQEAWEEAGLLGVLRREPIGSYLHRKADRSHGVTVFVMNVTEMARDWPERWKRRRFWLTPAQAGARIDQPGLQTLLREFAQQVRHEKQLPLPFRPHVEPFVSLPAIT